MSVAEALARVLEGAMSLPAENVPLIDGQGRVLTADVVALRTQPPADLSAMDGYAARAVDVAITPARLKLIGEVAAGHPFDGLVGAGEAARIFTGGVVPPGADTIVIGSHGRGGLERVLLGSVAEALMRASRIPVLVVHAANASRAVEKDGIALAATPHGDASQHG